MRIKDRIVSRYYATPYPYDVIVYRQGDNYYAKDGKGNIICKNSNTACIQEAVDYVYSNNGGGSIFIRSGIYTITKSINMTYNAPIAIVGEGPFRQELRDTSGITFIKYIGPAGTSDNPVSVLNADSGRFLPDQYIMLKNITLGLMGKAYPYTRAININNVNKFWIERVYTFAEGIYAPANQSYGFYTDRQGGNGGVMIDTFSANFYAAYKLYVDHFVAIRPQALYSTLGFWLHYAGSEIMLINPHAFNCKYSSFHIQLSLGGSATLIEPYSEGTPTYDYSISGANLYVTLINPRANRNPPVVTFSTVDFNKISIIGGTIRLKNSGVATISANSTRVTVTHNIVTTPSKVLITPLAQPLGKLWVENITSTSFDIVTDTAPTVDLKVAWYAEV